jgi:hypothetical protein
MRLSRLVLGAFLLLSETMRPIFRKASLALTYGSLGAVLGLIILHLAVEMGHKPGEQHAHLRLQD